MCAMPPTYWESASDREAVGGVLSMTRSTLRVMLFPGMSLAVIENRYEPSGSDVEFIAADEDEPSLVFVALGITTSSGVATPFLSVTFHDRTMSFDVTILSPTCCRVLFWPSMKMSATGGVLSTSNAEANEDTWPTESDESTLSLCIPSTSLISSGMSNVTLCTFGIAIKGLIGSPASIV